MDNKYAEQKPAMELVRSFFNPDQLHEPGMMDELLRGVAATSMETLDQFITSHVTNQLFEEEGQPFSGLDLAALNLQRGRDHGLPGYNLYRDAHRDAYSVARFGLLASSRNLDPSFIPILCVYRAICNLTRADDFGDLRREISPPVIERLRRTYEHVDDIDFFTGNQP